MPMFDFATRILLGHTAQRVDEQNALEDALGAILQRDTVRPDRFTRDRLAYHKEVDDAIEAAGDPDGDYY